MRPAQLIGVLAAFWVLVEMGSAEEVTMADLAANRVGSGPAGIEGNNGFIGVYTDPARTSTCATIAPGNVGTLYLFAFLDGPLTSGTAGAEFTIQVTHPEGYQFSYSAPSGTVTSPSVATSYVHPAASC